MSIEYGAEFSGSTQSVREHLDLNFFTETVENALRETDVRLQRIIITAGSSTGENYCSDIYRVHIHYELGNGRGDGVLPVIVKNLLNSGPTRFLEDLQVYLKEKIIYYDVLPRMELLLNDGQKKFGARLYHCVKQPVSSYAFEDLCARGFTMASRESGLNEAHARLVLQRLGEFHGISMHLRHLQPQLMNRKVFDIGMLNQVGLEPEDSMLLRFFSRNADALVAMVNEWPGYERIAAKISTYISNIKTNLMKAQAPSKANELCVLNHGDLWTNNIMFRYGSKIDSGNNNGAQREPIDVNFVDYQYSVWCSPGIDLNYFFYTSIQLEVLRERRPQLIEVYYEALSSVLKRLGDPVPSLQAVLQEVQRREAYGFFAQFGICPLVSMESTECGDNSLDNLADEEFARQKVAVMFKSPRLQAMLRYTLPYFDKMGVWD